MSVKSASCNGYYKIYNRDSAGVVIPASPTTSYNTQASSSSRAVTMKPSAAVRASMKSKAAVKKAARTTTKSTPVKPNITKSSVRKRTSSNINSSSPTASQDNTQSSSVAASPASAMVSNFHEARGLSFEELYVNSSNDANSSESVQTPQKGSKKATKASLKASTATASTPASTKSTKSTNSTNSAKPASRKRARQSDDVQQADAPVTPPKIILKLKRGSASTGRKSTTTDDADDSYDDTTPPAPKRLKLNVSKKASTTAQQPTPPATKTPTASKSKAKTGPVITKNGKVKKTPEYAIEHAFNGTASNFGYSIERPQFATLAEPWQCANLACNTGMTYVPRDTKDPISGKGPMGRKVISQFFGRNKGPTKLIPNDVWHYYCRKDYQRHRYAAEHKHDTDVNSQVIMNLRDQLIRLKFWRPDALFKVQLDKGASDRLNEYFALLRQHNNNDAAAEAALPAPKDTNKPKPEEVFPAALAETFNRRFKTEGKEATADYDDLESIIAWSEGEINAGRSPVFVPAEFLINEIQPGETVNDVSDNFNQWMVIHNRMKAERKAREAAAALALLRANGNASESESTASSPSGSSDIDSEMPDTPTPRARPGARGSQNPMSLMNILNDQDAESNTR